MRITNSLTNGKTLTDAIYGNQSEDFSETHNTEIIYYKEGAPTSSSKFTYDGSQLDLTGNFNTDGNVNIIGNLTNTGIAQLGGTASSGNYVEIHSGPNASYIDFHSTEGSNENYDATIISVGGVTGMNGGGTLIIQANKLILQGNTANPSPDLVLPGSIYFDGGPGLTDPVSLQGRLFPLRQLAFSGDCPAVPIPNTAKQIALMDPLSGLPYYGQYNVTMSNGFAGGNTIYQGLFSVTKGSNPSLINVAIQQEGNDLTGFSADFFWFSGVLTLSFKNYLTLPCRYIVTGTVYEDYEL